MMSDTRRKRRYELRITSGALLVHEALCGAPVHLREHDLAEVRELREEDTVLQSRTRSSGFRHARQVPQRLTVLGDAQVEMLIDATPTQRGYLRSAAACRRYDLIGEFAGEFSASSSAGCCPEFDGYEHDVVHPMARQNIAIDFDDGLTGGPSQVWRRPEGRGLGGA